MSRFISSKQPAHFPLFSQLPAELQLIIWTLAIPDPRVITYSKNYISRHEWYYGLSGPIHKTTYNNPGILGACYDSRREALKRYKPSFAIELGHHVYVDFARDTFEFGDFASLEAFSIKNTPFSGSKMESDKIRTVGITLEWALEEAVFKLICSNFGGMETLMVREKRCYGNMDMQPLSEFKGEEIEKVWPWLTGRVRRNIESRGGDWSGWKPPFVIRGTEAQWERILKERMRENLGEMIEEMDWELIRDDKRQGGKE